MTRASEQLHVWQRCHGCDAAPIVGVRFDCRSCPEGPDSSLCEHCYEKYRRGSLPHPRPASAFGHLALPTHDFQQHEGTSREAYAAWARVPDARCPPPAVPDRFVLRPEFRRGDVSAIGTYAFALDAPPCRLVVTALHVLDELAALAAGTPTTAARQVDHVELYDVFAPQWMFAHLGSVGDMLTLPLAATGDPEPYCQRDVAAFAASVHSPFVHVPLAPRSPQVGDPVWLATNPAARAAVVVEASERALIFRFADSPRLRRATSGAPLLDRHGHVAGINVGGGALDGRQFGHAVHAESLRKQLASAALAASSRAAHAGGASE
jgi:hypothetical protein